MNKELTKQRLNSIKITTQEAYFTNTTDLKIIRHLKQ